MLLQSLLTTLLLFILPATAQFQFFEQMFNGNQQQQQQQRPQNAGSDSQWYQQNYEQGAHPSIS
jgi:hypothetical protein